LLKCPRFDHKRNATLVSATELAGRFLLASLFLLAGLGKLGAYSATPAYADQTQMIMFLKNVSIAGGFLLLIAHGAGPLSLDRRFARQ
jgi:putative oxidoreductase